MTTSLDGSKGVIFPDNSEQASAAWTGFRNRLYNGNFPINQRGVSGTVTLAAGAYGHDRWKAGAGGCTYTFATSGIDTVITITAGSLMQVIEDRNIEGGVYTLAHAGTAQARIAINGVATAGVYAAASVAAPLKTAATNANQQITVEFSTGTVSKAQLEPGATANPFERRPYGMELAMCQRYYWKDKATGAGYRFGSFGSAYSATGALITVKMPVSMRTFPSIGYGGATSDFRVADGVSSQAAAVVQVNGSGNQDNSAVSLSVTNGAWTLTTYRPYVLEAVNANAYIDYNAEL